MITMRAFLAWRMANDQTKPNVEEMQDLYQTVTQQVRTRVEASVGGMRAEIEQLVENVSLKMQQSQRVLKCAIKNRLSQKTLMRVCYRGWAVVLAVRKDVAAQGRRAAILMHRMIARNGRQMWLPFVQQLIIRTWGHLASRKRAILDAASKTRSPLLGGGDDVGHGASPGGDLV
ncbi:unnamed protein product, partial [Amoebophrya sp. A25]|eukprot:GSA25T00005390001.1